MAKKKVAPRQLGGRERQIMDAVYRLQSASVADVRSALSDPPSYSAVRTMLGILVGKGLLSRREDGVRHLYSPTRPREVAGRGALAHLVSTFFSGSPSQAFAALLDASASELSDEELDRLQEQIDAARHREQKT